MITRIVKMHFTPDSVDEFLNVLHEHLEKIRGFPGCLGVEVLQDINNPQIIMTYSHWVTPDDLEAYRHSELFKLVWTKTKILFLKKAEAWSLRSIH